MQHRLIIDGRERTFETVGSDAGTAGRPLVLVLHGSKENARTHRKATGDALSGVAEADAVVAYLDGYRGNWNDARRRVAFPARREGIDDVAFVRAVIDQLVSTHRIDPRRVVAVGYSNGGHMVMRMLHESSIPLAGAVIMAATLPTAEDFLLAQGGVAQHPVPVVLAHGTADRIARYRGGRPSAWVRIAVGLDGDFVSAPDTARYFAARNGITAPPTTARIEPHHPGTPIVERTRYAEPGHPAVTLYTIDGGGHTVPAHTSAPRILGPTARDATVADFVREVLAG